MKVVYSRSEASEYCLNQLKEGNSVGFVPTMGALHKGHIGLILKAKSENDVVVVSIFVNPAQFNNQEDFNNYPNTLESDVLKLKESGCDMVFVPSVEDMYPSGVRLLDFDISNYDSVMEGKFRPGHFNGMITVVDLFFSAITPTKAYFGEKDFQQLLIIKELAKNRYPSMEIIPCATDRDDNGLALSSRNMRLNSDDYQIAIQIPKVLGLGKQLKQQNAPNETAELLRIELNKVNGLRLEYLEILDDRNLLKLSDWKSGCSRVFVAAFVGSVRLIDNMAL
ncbi:MAG: pantoate--beta-alanine ligase [Flavobacteriales bacterium]|nr:pantoate--beta-alanine ligase [Flavobacteriales bacterium]